MRATGTARLLAGLALAAVAVASCTPNDVVGRAQGTPPAAAAGADAPDTPAPPGPAAGGGTELTAAGAVLAAPASPRVRAVPADRSCADLAQPGFTARCGPARTAAGELLWLVERRSPGLGHRVEVLRVRGAEAEVLLEAVDDEGTRFDDVRVVVADVTGDGSEELGVAFYRSGPEQVLALDLVDPSGMVVMHREYVQGSARLVPGRLEAWEAVRDARTGATVLVQETIEARDGGWHRAVVATTTSPAVYGQDFADPYVLEAAGTWYAYSTNRRGRNVPVIRSDDLRDWHPVGDALPELPAWSGRGRVWAPAVLARAGAYGLYYTTRVQGTDLQCVSVATASSPAGPFVDRSTGPFVCQADRGGSIDASPFVDVDGTAYLLWKSEDRGDGYPATIWSRRLSDDGLSLLGPAAPILEHDRDWERRTIEAPSMVRDGDSLHLFYSGGQWQGTAYAVGHAVCASPAGPCTKATTPVIASNGVLSGPGGQEVVHGPDGRRWLAYHAWVPAEGGYAAGARRLLHVTPLRFEDGPVLGDAGSSVE